MKVHIGPYLKWWGPYQIVDLLFSWLLSEEKRDKLGDFLSDKTPLGKICAKIYHKRSRKTKIVIDDYDCWNADITLALIIHPLLLKIKEKKLGTPFTEYVDCPHDFKDDETATETGGDHSEERWDWILSEMIYAFEKHATFDNDINDFTLPDPDPRMENGRRLFAKYYFCLWL